MMGNPGDQDLENMLGLIAQGYAVTFEGSEVGDYFCLLRRIGTNELVNCAIGNTISGALGAAADWAVSPRDGNGTASRPPAAEEQPELFRTVTANRLKKLEEQMSSLIDRADRAEEEAEVFDTNTESMFASVIARLANLERMLGVEAPEQAAARRDALLLSQWQPGESLPPVPASTAEPVCGAQTADGPCVLRPHEEDQPHVAYILPPAGEHPYPPRRVPGAQHPDPARRPEFHPAEKM
jgi:hypothetical protein